MCQIFEKDLFIKECFGSVELGDKRLNKRLEKVAKRMIDNPKASVPAQMSTWNEAIGCYRLLNNPHVTHKRVQSSHLMNTRKRATDSNKVILFIQDGSEIETQKSTKGTGPIGNHTVQGIMMHNCLAVEYDEKNPKVIGLANQRIWERDDIVLSRSETRSQRNKRTGKESEHWLKTLKSIGSPPEKTRWVSVGDRGSDVYEYISGSKKLGWESVTRASQDRLVEVNGEPRHLKEWAASLEVCGSKKIWIRRKNETKAKEVEVFISFGTVIISPPKRLGKKEEPIALSVIRCFNEEEEIDWILYSTIPVNSFEEAVEKTNWYATRWTIEEYHKCLKTGCKIESNQFENVEPVEVLLGILSIVATLLIQMKQLGRDESNTLAQEVTPDIALKIICKRYQLDKEKITVRDFWRAVAMLGGFLGRKSDKDPGWQTIWGGWLRLLDMWVGAEILMGI